jgi:hypothetical protein
VHDADPAIDQLAGGVLVGRRRRPGSKSMRTVAGSVPAIQMKALLIGFMVRSR